MEQQIEEVDLWQKLKDDLQTEVDQYRRELREIALMLEQSQSEVNKLAQRNASITAHLQQIQGQFDTLPRAEIRMAYDSALDAQQRLFVMRGQVEKLQSDQAHISRHVAMLERILQLCESGQISGANTRSTSVAAETMELLIQAQEAERQRLSRQMHDGPAQALSNFILQTEIAMRLFDIDQKKARDELASIKSAATVTFQKVRDFIFELRPMMLDDLGLVPTLKRFIDTYKEQSGMDIHITVTGVERRLEPYQEVMIFRSVQEFLNTASRVSQATQVNILLEMGEANFKVLFDDNGKGLDADAIEDQSNMGLKIIRDRAEMIGGSLRVDEGAGNGTRIIFQIPVMARSV